MSIYDKTQTNRSAQRKAELDSLATKLGYKNYSGFSTALLGAFRNGTLKKTLEALLRLNL